MTCRVATNDALKVAMAFSNWSIAFATPPRFRMMVLFRVTLQAWIQPKGVDMEIENPRPKETNQIEMVDLFSRPWAHGHGDSSRFST